MHILNQREEKKMYNCDFFINCYTSLILQNGKQLPEIRFKPQLAD